MNDAHDVECVVIVTEALVEQRLLRDLRACGARGWTITAARGSGPDDQHVSEVEAGSIRVETLVTSEVARGIWDMLERQYFPDFSVAAWSYGVRVARLDRYSRRQPEEP